MPVKMCFYIPCRNGEAFLPEVLAAVAMQTRKPFLRLLVDDQSTDHTANIALSAGWTVTATTRDRSGLAAARNKAIEVAQAAGCDVLAGIDADAVPCVDYVETLTNFYEENPAISGVGGNMRERFSDTPSDFWRAVHMRQHWGELVRDNPPILYGSSASHRLVALQAVGGFNESLRTNFEDTDLTQRLLAANHRLAYLPALRLEHLKRDTVDSVLRMFWNWYLPPAVLAGHLASVEAWLRYRHPWIWADYRSRSRLDDAFPEISLVTVALPWIQVVRDLNLLAESLGKSVDVTSIAGVAERLLRESGHSASVARWLAGLMRLAAAHCSPVEMEPLNPAVINAVAAEAGASLPRRSFWGHVDRSARVLGIDGMPS